jgi:hypothetical protein
MDDSPAADRTGTIAEKRFTVGKDETMATAQLVSVEEYLQDLAGMKMRVIQVRGSGKD